MRRLTQKRLYLHIYMKILSHSGEVILTLSQLATGLLSCEVRLMKPLGCVVKRFDPTRSPLPWFAPHRFLLYSCLSASFFRFMPRVEIVQKHNTAARRLYIRGHNGKIYPYLVMNDACLTESRREERVLQLLRLLNPCLEKRKETTKRHLFFTGKTIDKIKEACVHELFY